jgi:hypothetical protein
MGRYYFTSFIKLKIFLSSRHKPRVVSETAESET